MKKDKDYRINNVITYFFITATIITIVVTMISVLLLNQREIKLIRENNLEKTHDTLSNLIAPAVDISDGTSIIRQLSLASDENQFFVVIDNNADIFAPNADDMELVQQYFGKSIKKLTCKNTETFFKQINETNYWVKCSNLASTDLTNSQNFIGILVSFSKNILLPTFSLGIYSLGIAMLTIFLIGFFFRRFLKKHLLTPLVQISAYIQSTEINATENEMQIKNFSTMPLEIKVIKDKFENLLINLRIENNKRIEYEKQEVLFELAAQVAHDIRSPLLAVDSFFKMVEKKLLESERFFGRRQIRMLDDIAWSLLSRYKNKGEEKNDNEDCYVFLYSCILELLSEKRMEYSKKNIDFEFVLNQSDAFSLVYLSPANLKRLISNMINNSVNSIMIENGMVEISLDLNIAGYLLSIKDNGCGMSPEFLKTILDNTRSERAKTNLGLPSAFKFLEQIGGALDIESMEGKGTTVNISLPFCDNPSWCFSEYRVHSDDLLLIIDDSQSVHDVWDEMFKKIPDIKYKHLYEPNEAIAFFKEEKAESLVIFCDYEFFEEDKNGFDVLDQAPENALKIIVTSHLYEPKIMKVAIDKGFKLLPKDLVPHFTLENIKSDDLNEKISLIFIDDDIRNTESWRFFADAKNLKIMTYNTTESFFRDAPYFNKDIPIYIDLNLSEEKDGVAYAKDIYELGFVTIYIATGSISIDLKAEDYPWLTGIIEKRFPFL